jgi:hypothetical protein
MAQENQVVSEIKMYTLAAGLRWWCGATRR